MAETNSDMSSSNLASFSVFELALLEMTTPGQIEDDAQDSSSPVVISGKEAYLWAGAIALALQERPNLSVERLIYVLRRVVYANYELLGQHYESTNFNQDLSPALIRLMVTAFLREVGLTEYSFSIVTTETERTYRRLLERGLIVDPISKRVKGILLSVLLLMPVNFTSRTIAGQKVHQEVSAVHQEVSAVGWSYTMDKHDGVTELHVKIKAVEAVKLFKEKIVPAFEGALEGATAAEAEHKGSA